MKKVMKKVMKTGDYRVVFVSGGGHYNMVVQRFSETLQDNYKAEVPFSVGRYWLTDMPVKVDFSTEVMTRIRDEFNLLLNVEKIAYGINNKDIETKFVITQSKKKQSYFKIPVFLSNRNIINININGSCDDINNSRLYATKQITEHHLWAITGSELSLSYGENQLQYLLDTSITAVFLGKAITNLKLEEILLSSVKLCKDVELVP